MGILEFLESIEKGLTTRVLLKLKKILGVCVDIA